MKRKSGTGRVGPPGRLRIVAGKWRSRVLAVADVPGLRPTPERIRETLFNWLAPVIEGARCLDLFAGTGALGLEALSRGAASALFVEKHPEAAAVLEQNARTLGAPNAAVVRGDATRVLETMVPGSADIVFLDPPFAEDLLGDLCRLIGERHIVGPGGRVYTEQWRGQPVPALPTGWATEKTKVAGQVRYSLIRVTE